MAQVVVRDTMEEVPELVTLGYLPLVEEAQATSEVVLQLTLSFMHQDLQLITTRQYYLVGLLDLITFLELASVTSGLTIPYSPQEAMVQLC